MSQITRKFACLDFDINVDLVLTHTNMMITAPSAHAGKGIIAALTCRGQGHKRLCAVLGAVFHCLILLVAMATFV